jgi:CRP-like cAMP-binding protein
LREADYTITANRAIRVPFGSCLPASTESGSPAPAGYDEVEFVSRPPKGLDQPLSSVVKNAKGSHGSVPQVWAGCPVTIEDDIAILSRVPTFAKFGFAALQIVAIGSEARQLADGETLFTAGETTDAGYVIQVGSLRLTTNDPKSESAIAFGPGTLIGELALLTETVCPATAVAVEPTTVIRISRNLFRKVLEGFPDAAALMRDRLAVRVNQSNAELVRLHAMLEGQPARSELESAKAPHKIPPGDVRSSSPGAGQEATGRTNGAAWWDRWRPARPSR